jgi:hypothetical protein
VALALRDRRHEVDLAVRQRFPLLRRTRTTASSAAGLADGRRAAEQADLGRRRLGA